MTTKHISKLTTTPINTAKNWLLIRGLTRESGHWGAFKSQMQEAFRYSKVYTVDLPGTGVLYQEQSPCSISSMTAHIRKQAHHYGWLEAPVNVLAVSLGGMIAWDWLQTYPQEINSSVLINISLAGINPFYQRLRWQCYLDLVRIIFQPDINERERAIIKLISNRADRYEALAQDWQGIQRKHPVSGKTALYQLVAAARYRPQSQKPLMPVLLLNSLGDRLVSPYCTQTICQHWDLPFNTHPSAGHDLTTDEGDWVIGQIRDWIAMQQ